MTVEELNSILIGVIENDTRHEYYDRTVQVKNWCYQIMTGNDQAELIVQYKKRESDEQKKQRVAITNSLTRYPANRVYSTFGKVSKVDDEVDNITFKNIESKEEKVKKISEQLEDYRAEQDCKAYTHEAVRHLNFYDPNAWILVNFNESGKAYPIEIYSDQVMDFGEDYLIYREPVEVMDKNGNSDSGFDYIAVMADWTFKYLYKGKNGFPSEEYVSIDKVIYDVESYNTKSGVFPAVRVGYLKDPETNRETFVSPLYPAEHIFKDIINTKSEYDLSRALHGFIQKFAMANTCKNRYESDGIVYACQNGSFSDGTKCDNCKGTGLVLHKTVQDVVLIQIPEGRDELIPLDQMVHYVEIPEHQIQRHKDDLKELLQDVSKAIFNVDIFDREQVYTTATEKVVDLEGQQDVIYEFAQCVSRVYKFQVYMAAVYANADAGIIIEHQPPRDFRLESIHDLMQLRKNAIEADAPYEVISQIDKKILAKQAINDVALVHFIEAKEKFKPFKEKATEEIMYLLSILPNNDRQVVLYINFEAIFDTIKYDWENVFNEVLGSEEREWTDEEIPYFAHIPYEYQRKVVDYLIDKYMPEASSFTGDYLNFLEEE